MELHRLRLPGKTLQNYTRLLVTFIVKTNVFKRISNCINVWTLFGVILNTGFDVFLYLRYGFTYRLLFFFGGGSQHMVLVHQAFRKSLLNFLWTSCEILWVPFVFLRNFLCNSYAVFTTSYVLGKSVCSFGKSVWSF